MNPWLVLNLMVLAVAMLVALFKEDGATALLVGVYVVAWSVFGWMIYVAAHFIGKYW